MKLETVLYRADATTTTESTSSLYPPLSLVLSTPSELGGAGGEGTNPEQLFAAGYSACFLGAIKYVAAKEKIKLPNEVSVRGLAAIGPISHGFGFEAELQIAIPGMDRNQAMGLIEKAHQVCPYSNATRGNIVVKFDLV